MYARLGMMGVYQSENFTVDIGQPMKTKITE